MKKLLCTTALVIAMSTSNAMADDDLARELQSLKAQLKAQQKLINKLEARLNSKNAQQDKDIAKLKSAPAAAVKGDVKITMTPSPKIESTDGKYSFQPIGRIHLDGAVFNDDKNDHPDGATFRRARIGFKGKIDTDIHYKMDLDFGNKDSDDSVSIKDLYVAYTGLKHANIKVGNFKPAYSLEELTNPNYRTFIESSVATDSFVTGQIIGAQLYNNGENYSWAIGVHNDKTTTKSSDDEAKSIVGRLTYAPIMEGNNVLHLGISQAHRVPDSANDSVSFDAKSENAIQSLESAETGTITGVENVDLTGLEIAGVYGPLSLQGEYFHNSIDRETAEDFDVSGWYTQASYFITGESRPYNVKKGAFGKVIPNNKFSLKDGGSGAWELVARYSNIDLNDGNIQGGEIDNVTVGVNWYLNKNTRLMANYIMSDGDSVTPSGSNVAANDDPNILLLRAAIEF